MRRPKFNTKSSRRDFLKTGAAALGSLPLARGALRAAPQTGTEGKAIENVILIMSDTLRRDTLSCYGGDWVHTPHLDRFAH